MNYSKKQSGFSQLFSGLALLLPRLRGRGKEPRPTPNNTATLDLILRISDKTEPSKVKPVFGLRDLQTLPSEDG